MRVAIDIRRAGNFGIGTYIRNIVNQFARTDSQTEYLLIGQQRHLREFDLLPENFELLEYASDPGSFHTHLHLPFLLRKHGVRATFLFSLGPDHTGRAIKRVFRPGFVGKVRRTSVVRHYGVKTLLYGTVLPGPDIGRRAAEVKR